MYLWWSLCIFYLHACQARVTVGDSGFLFPCVLKQNQKKQRKEKKNCLGFYVGYIFMKRQNRNITDAENMKDI